MTAFPDDIAETIAAHFLQCETDAARFAVQRDAVNVCREVKGDDAARRLAEYLGVPYDAC